MSTQLFADFQERENKIDNEFSDAHLPRSGSNGVSLLLETIEQKLAAAGIIGARCILLERLHGDVKQCVKEIKDKADRDAMIKKRKKIYYKFYRSWTTLTGIEGLEDLLKDEVKRLKCAKRAELGTEECADADKDIALLLGSHLLLWKRLLNLIDEKMKKKEKMEQNAKDRKRKLGEGGDDDDEEEEEEEGTSTRPRIEY